MKNHCLSHYFDNSLAIACISYATKLILLLFSFTQITTFATVVAWYVVFFLLFLWPNKVSVLCLHIFCLYTYIARDFFWFVAQICFLYFPSSLHTHTINSPVYIHNRIWIRVCGLWYGKNGSQLRFYCCFVFCPHFFYF